ncbi:MAG: PRC-barrel domain-containing protein [Halobacteriales archaeon]
MESVRQEITSLVGREVYTNNGVFIGEVEDLQLDIETNAVTGLALHRLNGDLFDEYVGDARGVMLPYRWVKSVGDVVLVNDIVERIKDREDED